MAIADADPSIDIDALIAISQHGTGVEGLAHQHATTVTDKALRRRTVKMLTDVIS